MKPPDLQAAILAHLRRAESPVSGRDLAARFLRIHSADEATCHRLLAPLLAAVTGVRHVPGTGWTCEGREPAEVSPGPGDFAEEAAFATPGVEDLGDFVALAADGAGPGGSGALRALSFVPVVGGEELQEEHFPAQDADSDDVAAPVMAKRGQVRLTAVDMRSFVEAVGDLPVVAHRVSREVEPIRRAALEAGWSFYPAVISTARLGHLLLGLKANHAASDLAAALGAEAPGPDDCRGRSRLVARSFMKIVPLLRDRGIATVAALLEFQNLPAGSVDLTGRAFTTEDLKALPTGPGVYRFLDRDRQVIYVGKAGNLRTRVGSYFTPSARGTPKGRAILEQTHRIEHDAVASDLEAALLEAALLAEHHPRLNRQFEIHERPAPYGPRLNLVVVLKDKGTGTASCTLHFLRGGLYLRRVTGLTSIVREPPQARVALDPWREVLSTLATYFGGEGAAAPGHGADLDWQLVGSYLRRFRDDTNVLDVDESRDAESAAERLRVLIAATAAGSGRTLAR